MPSIYLKETTGTYRARDSTVSVSEKPYQISNLFKSYRHNFVSYFDPNYIYLYKGSSLLGNYGRLKLGSNYKNSRLKHAEVYFSRFDATNTPLACYLKFDNGKNRIYKNFEHRYLIDRNSDKDITVLTEFDDSNEKKLLELLIEQNDINSHSITYELDRTNSTTKPLYYNSDKIILSAKGNIRGHHSNDFHKYTHKRYNRYTGSKSFVLYKDNVPMKNDKIFLENIQGELYESVNVYFSNELKTPLLIELNKGSKKLYIQRISNDESQWMENNKQYPTYNELINYLKEIFEFLKREPKIEKKHEKSKETIEKEKIQLTRSTEDQGSSTTQTRQDTQEPTGLGTPSGGEDRSRTPPLVPKPTLTPKICVLINKQQQYQKSDVETICQTGNPKFKLSDEQPENISVKPSDLNATDYKYYTHDITPNPSKSKEPEQQDIELNIYISNFLIFLYGGTGKSQDNLIFKPGQDGDKLLVYFYKHSTTNKTDTVPLMIHYDGKFYGPNNRDEYFTGWLLIDDINGTSAESVIKNKLNNIYSEVSKIELDFKNGTTCTYGIRKVSTVNIQDFKTERVTVKVEQISSTTTQPAAPLSSSECGTIEPKCPNDSYVKYTHTTINKFKLGNIVYKSKEVKVIEYNGGPGSTANPITIQSTQNLVSVYYWVNDTSRTYPLLIGIGKQNGGAGSTDQDNIDEYYKLINTTPSEYKWKQLSHDEKPGLPGTDNTKLVNLLDKINYEVKKVIKILIEKRSPYQLCLSTDAGGKSNTYNQENGGKKIQVEECKNNGCEKLSEQGYKCYEHKISEINGNGNGFNYNSIGGLKFYISGNGADIEIKLHKDNDSGGDVSSNEPINQLTYNTCMGDVFVYFYCKHGTDDPDRIPLMLRYNGSYYRPEDRDQYFNKWSYQPASEKFKTTCGNENKEAEDSYEILFTMLDLTNKALNRINLTKTSGQYGIPPPETQPAIDLNRVNVTTISSKDSANRPYVKIVHRTINSFTIGDIWYGVQDIMAGVQINGVGGEKTKIETGSGRDNHKVFVQKNNSQNTVIAYYSTGDSGFKLPQVILLMTTENSIEQGEKPIISKEGTTYGYYVLSICKGGTGYKYEWRRPYDEHSSKPLTLDEQTEFSLLNAITILVEKQKTYNEGEIKPAVRSSGITSPGNESGVNRLKEKTIDAHEETGINAERYGDPGKCLSKYGYRLWTHDITALVEWKPTGESNGQPGIPLIGGFRFLVPSSTKPDSYEEISLYSKDKTREPVDRLYHIRTKNSIYIFFYGSDPRPLLLCYNGFAYKPKKQSDPIPEMQVIMDYSKWTRVTSISQCTCMGNIFTNDDHILDSLLEVVCFLNPVQLNPTKIPGPPSAVIISESPKPPGKTSRNATYKLHQFTNDKIVKMNITRTDVGCYEKYIYEPDGTGGSGQGFRLGSVHYTDSKFTNKFNHLNYNSIDSKYRHQPLLRVTVYYYDHDKEYKDPLLIELEFNTNGGVVPPANHKEYYMLNTLIDKQGIGMTWVKDPDAFGKFTGDQNNQIIVNHLDIIRYLFKKVLQIQIAIKKADSYDAKLFNTTGHPVKPEQSIQVTVSEETECPYLNGTGFRRFKHGISTLGSDQLHKFGAVLFYIPDQEGTSQVKLNLYDTQSTGLVPIQPLYYNCGMGDICVFFYGSGSGGNASTNNGDPRPLLLCYNNKGYKPRSMFTYDNHIWLKSNEITDCTCKSGNNELLKALVKVCNFLNPVYINRTVRGVYRIHRFNGQHIEIQLQETKAQSSFCYNKYVHSPKPGFRLGRIEIESSKQCIYEWTAVGGSDKCITSVLDDPLDKYTPASEVVVYYYQGDKMYKNPLLVVLCKKGEVGVRSTTSTCQCKPYYELQRSAGTSTTNKKVYKKVDNTIELDSRKGKQLEKTLDRILYYISKSLLIDLSFRKTTKPVDIEKPKKHCTKTWEGSYISKVYENELEKPKKIGKTIDVIVCGPTPILDSNKETGYLCYRHKISTVQNVDQIGGLRLFLWDNRKGDVPENDNECKGDQAKFRTKRECCEISLVKPTWVELEYIIPITYTVCKGDLYVYFYGSDPRPLLLCYNGQAYKPSDLETYDQKWCRVPGIESCQCDVKGFTASKNLLEQLYQISMFLNPVRLSETLQAYKQVKKFIEEEKAKKKVKIDKLPEHDYTVQTFGHREIKIRVQSTDLQCCRKSISSRDCKELGC